MDPVKIELDLKKKKVDFLFKQIGLKEPLLAKTQREKNQSCPEKRKQCHLSGGYNKK